MRFYVVRYYVFYYIKRISSTRFASATLADLEELGTLPGFLARCGLPQDLIHSIDLLHCAQFHH